jgi:hypothetical protein
LLVVSGPLPEAGSLLLNQQHDETILTVLAVSNLDAALESIDPQFEHADYSGD